MGTITRSHSFTAGEVPTAAQFNVDINQIISTLNGSVDAANVDTTAVVTIGDTQTISGSKTFSAIASAVITAITNSVTWSKPQYATPKTDYVTTGAISWDSTAVQVAEIGALTGNVTVTFTDPSTVAGCMYFCKVTQSSGGSNTIAFEVAGGGTVQWPGGTDPVLTAAANSIDLFSFYTDGTNMFGTAQQDFSE